MENRILASGPFCFCFPGLTRILWDASSSSCGDDQRQRDPFSFLPEKMAASFDLLLLMRGADVLILCPKAIALPLDGEANKNSVERSFYRPRPPAFLSFRFPPIHPRLNPQRETRRRWMVTVETDTVHDRNRQNTYDG